MENSTRQTIKTQLTAAWGKFQPDRAARNRSDRQDEIDEPEPLDRQIEVVGNRTHRVGYGQVDLDRQGITEVSAIEPIPDRNLFSDVVAPISKLNIPTVNVDPWSAFWAVLAAMVGGTGITSYLLLIAVPPTPNCQGVLPISTDSERLYCAQVGADTKEIPRLRAAVDLVKGWTDRHPLYGESQRLLKGWSEDLTKIGRKQLNDGKIEQAIATLKIVPISSPVYDRTQVTIAKWSSEAQDSAKIDSKFEQSMKSGDWNQAFVILQTVQRMRGTYWNSYKHDKMASKLAQERDAWDKLQEAKDALTNKEGDDYNTRAKRLELAVKTAAGKGKDKVVEIPLPKEPEPILKAMQLANKIDPTTYVYHEGQTLRSKWSKHLVQLSVGLYKSQNFSEAIEKEKKNFELKSTNLYLS